MNLRTFLIYLTGILLMLSGCSSTQMDTSITDRDVRVTDYLDKLIENEEYPGIQYMVLTEDKVVYQYSGGYADIFANINMDLSISTYIYSITKIITAACILQLYEKGIIDIDSSIQTYWPDIPYNATIRQILCHNAGIPNPVWGNYFIHWPNEHSDMNRNRLLDNILAENPLQSKPGEKVSYSNLGYAVLGRLIEIVTGDLYEDYVQKNIFNPLGISANDSSYLPPPVSNLATPYIKSTSFIEGIMLGSLKGNTLTDHGNWKATRKAFIFDLPAHGGLITSAQSFSLFLMDQLSAESKLFSIETKKLFYTEQSAGDEKYACGLRIIDADGTPCYSHTGGAIAISTIVCIYPTQGIATIFLTNRLDSTRIRDTDILVLDKEFLQ